MLLGVHYRDWIFGLVSIVTIPLIFGFVARGLLSETAQQVFTVQNIAVFSIIYFIFLIVTNLLVNLIGFQGSVAVLDR